MRIKNLILLLLAAALTSCGGSQVITASWINKQVPPDKKYNKVFIAVLTQNLAARTSLEKDLAAEAESRGINVIKSIDVIPPNVNVIDSNLLKQKVVESKSDAIFIVALVNSKAEERYVPPTTTTTTAPVYTPGTPNYGGYYYNSGYQSNYYGSSAYYGNYGNPYGYYQTVSSTVTTEGYYTTDYTYYLEGSLFDTQNGSLLYSVQSEAYNPGSIESEAKAYTRLVFAQMEKDGLIKPKSKK